MADLTSVTVAVGDAAAHLLHREGSGPARVLLHGAGGNAETWREVLPGAGDIYAVDLPGRGGSHGPAKRDVEAIAGWLVELLDALGLEAPVVIGHSMGGAVGLSLALLAPERVRALVSVCSSARLRVAPALLQAVENATQPLSYAFAFGPESSPGAAERYDVVAQGTPIATLAADWRACDVFDVRSRVATLEVPTLVLGGAEDRLTPEKHQRWLAETLPKGELRTVAGAGHMLPWENPARMWAGVEEWLSAR